MTDRTGILKNTPLIYSLASIRFAPWPFLAKKIDEIHDQLRDILPLISAVQTQTLGLDGQVTQSESVAPTVWVLMALDRSNGIQLSPDQLLIFSKNYSRYSNFEATIKTVLEKLLEHMRFVDVINAGVRYVDRIELLEGETFNDYLSADILPADIPRLERIGGETFGVYRSEEAELRVRCVSQPRALNVPMDLLSVIALASAPDSPLKFEYLKSNQLLLDMDSVKAFSDPKRMTEEGILELLNSLHKKANAFFRHEAVCTEHAFKIWRGE